MEQIPKIEVCLQDSFFSRCNYGATRTVVPAYMLIHNTTIDKLNVMLHIKQLGQTFKTSVIVSIVDLQMEIYRAETIAEAF